MDVHTSSHISGMPSHAKQTIRALLSPEQKREYGFPLYMEVMTVLRASISVGPGVL